MTSSFLRRIRIVFSICVLVLFMMAFSDLPHLIPASYTSKLLFLQFIPSLVTFINIKTLAGTGFLIILLLTVITGRTYCSFLCPLGILQDIFSRTGGRIRKKFRRYGYRTPFTLLRYLLLALTLVVTLAWGLYAVIILDPYSIFGRIMTFFIKPGLIIINNLAAGSLDKFNNYTVSHIPHTGFSMAAYVLPSAFLILAGTLSLIKGRLYCNTVCPLGTLLGLISKISVFRIRFDERACTRCGRCAIGCKSSCIDFLKYDVDVTRCVDCFDCIHLCPDKALSYSPPTLRKESVIEAGKADEGRRRAVLTSLFLLAGFPLRLSGQEKQAPRPKKESTVRETRTFHVAPPGAGSIRDLNKWCTACSLCINTCPNGVLQPSIKEYGVQGFMQPVMDYHKSFCTYNCTVCTEICPTNALKPLMPEAKKLSQLGRAVFIKDNCIVKTEKTACGACSESCPTKAVYMIPYEGNLLIPEVNNDICIGCGHCEFSCPTTPYKAIYVDGNQVHKAAMKPENKESEIETPVEFPF